MKTRNIIAIIAALPIMAGMTGCKSDEELTAKPAKEILLVEGGNIEMRSGDESKNVAITANCSWVMTYDQTEWNSLTVQPQRGTGNGSLVITTDQNTTVYDRVETILLTSDGGLNQKITLRQVSGDPTINISAKTLNFAADPVGAQLLSIKSNVEGWKIQMPTGINWLHLDKMSGNVGTETVNVSVDPSQTDVARSTSFTILYGNSSADVLVAQEGMNSEDISLGVNTDQINLESSGGDQVIQVTSNAAWRAFVPSSAQSWLQIEPAQGIGNGEIHVHCQPNNNTERDRLSVIVIIAGTQNPQQVDVLVQQGVGSVQYPTLSDIEIMSHHMMPTEAMLFFEFNAASEVGEYGFCWSARNQVPTINDETQVVGSGGTQGFVEEFIGGLTPETTYYARGYVNFGGQVIYTPNVLTFTTPADTSEPSDGDNPDPNLSRQLR
ncbi:MAG: BACON domain-containing protein [Prevotella sp.]|nr:BACON domain-containing protein [Prevotella sp.]MBR1546486.1 BACON domain-containing protein [Prevotella sp.]